MTVPTLDAPVQPAQENDPQWIAYREAELTLLQMAQSLAPADARMRALTEELTAADELPFEARDDADSWSSEARTAEVLLRKAQARYRALVEQIPAVTFMAPLDGTSTELYVSPQIEVLLGFSATEWLNNPILWYSQLHPDDKERWQTEFARTLNAGEHFCSDYRFISRDGRIVWVHGEAKVVSDEHGQPIFLQGVAFDITERMEAEERLQYTNASLARAHDQALEASRAKSAFLANMSHELRTPLNAILGFTEMLRMDAQDTGHHAFMPDLDKIHGASTHLLRMIGGILDLSKIEAGKMELLVESFDIASTINEVVSTAIPIVEENGNTLEVICPEDVGSMRADETRLRQVLFNLLSNAGKFTERGCITLEVNRSSKPGGDWIRMSVTDTGIGITSEQMGKLFQSFSQGDDTTTRKYGGTGLGLAISDRFCQMMGGTLKVQSEPGVGSTFTVDLPAEVTPIFVETPQPFEVPTPAERVEPMPRKSAPVERGVPSILIIDDEPKVREMLQRSLAREGVNVITAASGAEGLRLAREVLPAAVTLDVRMPGLDGWQVLAAFKADPALVSVPVVLVTIEDESRRGFTLGAPDYLNTPINRTQLSGLLNKYRGHKPPGRVLIVDDTPSNREDLRRWVSEEGWTIAEAENGRTALKAVAESPPDLVLVDLLMPGMGGFDFIRVLRKTQSGLAIPIVLVTPRELTAEERRDLSNSVQAILQKSTVNSDEVLQEVGKLVEDCLRVKAELLVGDAAVGADGPPADTSLLRTLQRHLEQVKSERDAALASLQDQSTETTGASDRERQLEDEAAATALRLREQQQSVELLQAELAEVSAKVETLQDLEAQVEQLLGDRDAVLVERDAARKDLQRLIAREEAREERRRRASEKKALSPPDRPQRDQVEELKTLLQAVLTTPRDQARATDLGNGAVQQVASPPGGGGAARSAVASESTWQLVYQDGRGKPHTATASTADIRQWLSTGMFEVPTGVRVSRSPGGPFEPLGNVTEFQDLATPPLPHRAEARGPAGSLPPSSPTSSHDWMLWIVLVLGAIVAALVGQWLIFPRGG